MIADLALQVTDGDEADWDLPFAFPPRSGEHIATSIAEKWASRPPTAAVKLTNDMEIVGFDDPRRDRSEPMRNLCLTGGVDVQALVRSSAEDDRPQIRSLVTTGGGSKV